MKFDSSVFLLGPFSKIQITVSQYLIFFCSTKTMTDEITENPPPPRAPPIMEEEFRCLLDHFPIVRSRNYRADSELLRASTSYAGQDELMEWQNAWDDIDMKEIEIQGTNGQDPFWEKLRLAAEKKVGAAEAEQFCKSFRSVYKKLVYKELSSEAAQRFVNSVKKLNTADLI